MRESVSGYVPIYNNAATVRSAVESLRRQEPSLDEIVVIDDGSTDGGAESVQRDGVRIVGLEGNLGRGTARARACQETSGDFILSVDGTKALAPGFLEGALRHMLDPKVATVSGRMVQPASNRAVDRWRGRHLFKTGESPNRKSNNSLNTNGVLLRRAAVEAVGGFRSDLRHSEDFDLGVRLRRAGWKIIYDPDLVIFECVSNSWGQVFERHWRYNVGPEDRFTFKAWLVFVRLAWRVMIPRDLKDGDAVSGLVTLFYPFVLLCFWQSWKS